MRTTALLLAGMLALAACGREADAPAPEPIAPVGVAASDETSLAAPANGLAFWMHPNVAFNSLLIAASADGLAAYNIEDGAAVSSVPGVNVSGVAVSYLGFGPTATGVVAAFQPDASAFAFYRIDNGARNFAPLAGGPLASTLDIRGAVRGFCFGRGDGVETPSLYVVQRGKILVFNFEDQDSGLAPAANITMDAPDDLVTCAVDSDGALLTVSATGAIFRLDGEDSFKAPFARAQISEIGGLAVIAATAPEGDTPEGEEPAVYGQIALLDKSTGAVHLFDRTDGRALGAVTIQATDEIEGVTAAAAMGATGANLGGLYRDGLVALSVDGAAAVRFIPLNGLANALAFPVGAPVNPRGVVAPDEDDGLLINIEFVAE
ncbi:MAG: hypothetical protein GXP06_01785 [Alphaproteobacteria bacterium]|nr:hypothetical protein [Alphaproteobacteria bacterium]